MKQKLQEEVIYTEKAGIKKTAQQVKEEAANIVKNTIPNYAYVGDFVRAMQEQLLLEILCHGHQKYLEQVLV